MKLITVLPTWILLGSSLITLANAANTSTHWELKLFNDLMTSYNRNIRPVLNPHTQMTTTLNFALARIESLNEKSQVLTAFGWMQLMWYDEVLQWNPADYGGVEKMVVNGDQIWIPEVAMLNSVQQGSDLTLTTDFRVAVYPDGLCFWGPGFRWSTTCRVNLYYFPFDTQICEVQFVNWMYTGVELNMTNAASVVDLFYYESHGEWDLVSTAVDRVEIPNEGDDKVFTTPVVAFQLTLKRKPGYLLLNIVAPSIIMTIISILVFCLPAEAGEKVSLGITALLSFSVVLLMMSDITPRSSDNMPLLTLFTVISMAVTALSLISTVVVLRIHHHSPDKPLPQWVRSLFLHRVAGLLCMRRSRDAVNVVSDIKILTQERKMDHLTDNIDIIKKGAKVGLPEEFMAFVRMLRAKEVEKEEEERRRDDWAAVARVVDRLFFVLFALVMSVGASVILGVLLNNDHNGSTNDIIDIVPDDR